MQRIRLQKLAHQQPPQVVVPVYEYRSKLELLGLPLVHIRIGGGLEGGPVKLF